MPVKNGLSKLQKVDWDFPNSNKTDSIHSIHPYPAKFISEIPRNLIKIIGVPKDTWILDPFCGSGTTLTEAQLAGIPSLGIDLNPIACLMSSVKTRPLTKSLVPFAEKTISEARNGMTNIDIPNIPNLDHWFKRVVQEEVARLLLAIDLIPDEEIEVKEALKLALSSILVRVSNQDSDTRYVAVEKNIHSDDVYQNFLAASDRISSVKTSYRPKTWQAKIFQKNILTVTKEDISKPVGLVITSPPYPNAYEYWLYHKYRMFWLGYDPLAVKKSEIGARAHYFKKNHPTVDDFKKQMQFLLTLLHNVMVNGGHACIIIGRSKIHGEIIDNASIIMKIAEKVGFTTIEILQRKIAENRKSFNLSHANIKTEHILVFKK